MTTVKINPGRVYPSTVDVIKDTRRRLGKYSQSVLMEQAILLGCAVIDRAWCGSRCNLISEDASGVAHYAAGLTEEDFAAIASTWKNGRDED